MQEHINYEKNLKALRNLMKEKGLKSYIIANADPHNSEEPSYKYSKIRNQFSSYHAPAGTMIVTLEDSFIYTDGRFWVTAEKQLKGSKTKLVKMGKDGVLPLEAYIKENNLLPIGFDFSLFPYSYLNTLASNHIKNDDIKDVSLSSIINIIDNQEVKKIFKLNESLLTDSFDKKIEEIRSFLKKNECDSLLVTSLDEIAHVLGYRGFDIPYSPVFYSYLFISIDEIHLFIDKNKLDDNFSLKDKIIIHNYDDIFSFLKKRKDKIAFDILSSNLKITENIKNKVGVYSPILVSKSVKKEKEIKNILKYHIVDGYYVFKLMKYIFDNKDKQLSEYDYAMYLDSLRLNDKNCFELSFETIASVDSNATMMHYAPTEEIHSKVSKDNHLLLVDSGGQYYGATTDITRTFLIFNPTKEIIHDYTLTLKSQIALSTSIFMYGSSGHTLDIKAREVMWKEGLDYKCGTGHGVGYILNVHEGPIGFRYRSRAGVYDSEILRPGQVITVEPGVYKNDKYGIRLENELLVVEDKITDQGTFYKFKTITYCPYERKLIDKKMLNKDELNWLNSYHKEVYKKLYPLVKNNKDELKYLTYLTSEIK